MEGESYREREELGFRAAREASDSSPSFFCSHSPQNRATMSIKDAKSVSASGKGFEVEVRKAAQKFVGKSERKTFGELAEKTAENRCDTTPPKKHPPESVHPRVEHMRKYKILRSSVRKLDSPKSVVTIGSFSVELDFFIFCAFF